MSIASVLIDAMSRSGLSQKALAEQVGVTQSYISQICSGKKIPTISTLGRLSDCLGMSINDFFEKGMTSESEGVSAKMILSEEEKQLVRFYRSMDKRGRAVLSGIVSNM